MSSPPTIEVVLRNARADWSSAVLKGLKFPLSDDDSAYTLAWLERFLAAAAKPGETLHDNVLLQYTQLHLANAGNILSARGREWMPSLGLGVCPGEAPRLWTREDFTELGLGERPRPLMNQLFLVKPEARRLLWPSGSVLTCITDQPLPRLFPAMKALFLPTIQEPILQAFPYYFPLLNGTVPMDDDRMPPWSAGIRLYIRQSPDDGGIFIWSPVRLDAALRQSGLVPSADQPGTWKQA